MKPFARIILVSSLALAAAGRGKTANIQYPMMAEAN